MNYPIILAWLMHSMPFYFATEAGPEAPGPRRGFRPGALTRRAIEATQSHPHVTLTPAFRGGGDRLGGGVGAEVGRSSGLLGGLRGGPEDVVPLGLTHAQRVLSSACGVRGGLVGGLLNRRAT
jgi:hypothetical protein